MRQYVTCIVVALFSSLNELMGLSVSAQLYTPNNQELDSITAVFLPPYFASFALLLNKLC